MVSFALFLLEPVVTHGPVLLIFEVREAVRGERGGMGRERGRESKTKTDEGRQREGEKEGLAVDADAYSTCAPLDAV